VDSLGKRKLTSSPLRQPVKWEKTHVLRRRGTRFEYWVSGSSTSAPPAWAMEFSARRIQLRSSCSAESPPPLELNFNPHINHATLLGFISDDGRVALPALLHLADLGTFRITFAAGKGAALAYDAPRCREDYYLAFVNAAAITYGGCPG
jgi:hypothetical protein